MILRQRLPDRRPAETFPVECSGLHYVATIGRFPDGRIAELFLSNHKSGSSADAAARDAAIILSFALQFGADLETIRRAVSRDSRGQPTSIIGAALDKIEEDGR